MLHNDKEEFVKLLERVSAATGFPLRLIEKDYYLTLLLSGIKELDSRLVFKGGTCLNKIYYSYYRLSEDLDLTLKPPGGKWEKRSSRSNAMKPIKSRMRDFLKGFDIKIEDTEKTGRNESEQYIFNADYNSAVAGSDQKIKIEIGLRADTILPPLEKKIGHKFLHPFTGKELFDAGKVECLDLKELVAEKLRAASTREDIAPRDFYDIAYLIRSGFNFKDKGLIDMFKQKLDEDKKDNDLKKYQENLGRTKEEINHMNSLVEAQLLDVLTVEEQKSFDMAKAIELINQTMKGIL